MRGAIWVTHPPSVALWVFPGLAIGGAVLIHPPSLVPNGSKMGVPFATDGQPDALVAFMPFLLWLRLLKKLK